MKTLLFTSYRTGGAQVFEASFPKEEIRQLTAGAPVHSYSPALHPDRDRLFFVRGGGIRGLERAGLQEACIVEFPDAQKGPAGEA